MVPSGSYLPCTEYLAGIARKVISLLLPPFPPVHRVLTSHIARWNVHIIDVFEPETSSAIHKVFSSGSSMYGRGEPSQPIELGRNICNIYCQRESRQTDTNNDRSIRDTTIVATATEAQCIYRVFFSITLIQL